MATPSARRTPMVERLSSPPDSPRTVARPSAMAAKSTARWPIDLSPGTRDVAVERARRAAHAQASRRDRCRRSWTRRLAVCRSTASAPGASPADRRAARAKPIGHVHLVLLGDHHERLDVGRRGRADAPSTCVLSSAARCFIVFCSVERLDRPVRAGDDADVEAVADGERERQPVEVGGRVPASPRAAARAAAASAPAPP